MLWVDALNISIRHVNVSQCITNDNHDEDDDRYVDGHRDDNDFDRDDDFDRDNDDDADRYDDDDFDYYLDYHIHSY